MDEIAVRHYQTGDGKVPYQLWFEAIADHGVQAAVLARINRLRLGAFGDWKAVGDGVFELRVHHGAGLRVYFGRSGLQVIILLVGGTKRTQRSDIRVAKEYWHDYQARTKTSVRAR